MRKENKQSGVDGLLVLLAGLATILGLFAVWDSGYARAAKVGSLLPRELLYQAMWVIVSVACGWIVSKFGSETWKKYAPWGLYLTIFGLTLVELPIVGKTIGGAQRWINLGPFTIQPSEFAKLGMILFLAWAFALRPPLAEPKRTPRHWTEALDQVWLPKLLHAWPIWVTFIVFVVIERQPDFATGAVLLAVLLAMMIIGGTKLKTVAALCAVLAVFTIVFVNLESYRFERFVNHARRWETPYVHDEGFQSTRSEVGMARGGLLGVGIGQGEAKKTLPAPTTDFIISTIAEELGLVGAMAFLAILGGICWRLVHLARSADLFARLVLNGMAAWIAIQVLVNIIMANASVLPPVGIPLPFISAGGSSLIALWMGIGLCMGVLRSEPERAKQKEGQNAAHRHGRRNRRPRLSRA